MLSAIVMKNWWQKIVSSKIFFGKWRIFRRKKFSELQQLRAIIG
jgi:hypothetical protein